MRQHTERHKILKEKQDHVFLFGVCRIVQWLCCRNSVLGSLQQDSPADNISVAWRNSPMETHPAIHREAGSVEEHQDQFPSVLSFEVINTITNTIHNIKDSIFFSDVINTVTKAIHNIQDRTQSLQYSLKNAVQLNHEMRTSK